MSNFFRAILRPAPGRTRSTLLITLYLFVVALCLSSYWVTFFYSGYGVLNYVPDQLLPSLLNAAPLAALAFIFAFARFSFGYLLGFGFYTMFLGYLWLSKSSPFDYDHWLGSVSAFCSAIAFLVPALWITSPIRQIFVLSKDALDRMLTAVLIVAAVIVIAGASYNFRLVGVGDIYQFRQQIEFPAPLRYAIGNLAGALLPFAFACYAVRGKPLRAAAALILLLLLYPLTLTKLTLFAPFWLMYLAVLAWLCEARMAVIVSLLVPLLIGVALMVPSNLDVLSDEGFIAYFGAFNFRMIAVPSIALDLYSDYFSKHSLTHFCQLSLLKPFITCPYADPPWVIMNNNYGLGYVNASLFASEGVASVGLKWAPLTALALGLVVGFVNRLSSGLPARFILLSAGVISQVLANIPFATSLLSNGAAMLFLLWYITPREIFGAESTAPARHRVAETTDQTCVSSS